MTDGAEMSTNNGEMSALREELSAIVPTPRPSHARHNTSGSVMQMRRCKATIESASTNEGDEAPKRKKKRKH